MKILLVEDDEATVELLTSVLTADRHTVNIATDGQMGLMLAETYDYDLVLLDVLVPKLDGISLCRQLRSKGLQMPILLLTAKDSQTDKVLGLNAGADDYVVKPFDLEELKARIRALLRRSSAPIATILTWEQLRLDPDASEVTYKHIPIALTPKEFSILELFLRHPHRVFSRSAIIDRLWSLEESPAESAVTTHIKDLRQKLKAGGMAIDLIETVYGLGYRLKSTSATDDSSQPNNLSQPSKLPQGNGAPKPQATSQKSLASVHRVLEKFRTSFTAQLAVLQQANAALQTDELTEELQQQARQEAHKLAGSLGVFGYPDGSRLAQEAEYLLVDAAIPKQIVREQLSRLVIALQQELAKPAVSLPQSPLLESSLPQAPLPSQGTSGDSISSNPSALSLPTEEASEALLDARSVLFSSNGPVRSAAVRPTAVLFISNEAVLVQQLESVAAAEFRHLTLEIHLATSFEASRQTIAQILPDAIFLDLSVARSLETALLFLAELTHQYPTVPVLVFSEQDSLSDRVEVSRLGGKAFLPKPATIEQVLQAIHQAMPRPATEAKVLIVDDDLAILTALKQMLQPWGLRVSTLNNPQQFWHTLIATEPDLVVFDLEMPTFSGIDLCQVVRHDSQWGNLPILVVTAHTDPQSIRKVFAAGADDFIAKPVVGPELVTRILSRIERIRSRRDFSPTPKSKE